MLKRHLINGSSKKRKHTTSNSFRVESSANQLFSLFAFIWDIIAQNDKVQNYSVSISHVAELQSKLIFAISFRQIGT